MTPYRTPAEGETGLSSAEIRIGIDIGVIADGYARITHANGDPVLRAGWRPYLLRRMPQLEADLPGVGAMVRARLLALQSAGKLTAPARAHFEDTPC